MLLFLTRIALGWLFFYAGITKVLNPAWSAAGFLKTAKTFPAFYQSLIDPAVLPITNFVNEWGLTLLGISLILGIGVRLSAFLGGVLMLMYYFPGLDFPKIGQNSYLVDEHIIYALVLFYFSATRAGRVIGLEAWCAGLPICRRLPKLHEWFG